MLDAQRKFLDASIKYLSSYETMKVPDDDACLALQDAFKCGILAKEGAKRDQHLANLCEEGVGKNSGGDASVLFTIVESIHKNRFVRATELKAFVAGLEEHQAGRGDAMLSIVRHNIRAASHVYHNITFAQLAEILGVSADKAEKYAAEMIGNGSLRATIDQIEGSIDFASGAQTLRNFDDQIRSLCLTMGNIVEGIATQYPGLMKSSA